jgi:hypothetical protein
MAQPVEIRRLAMMIGHIPDEASPLVQVVRGSERAPGVHAIILRRPVSERCVLEKLGLVATDKIKERRPGVYVQITRPGEPFVNFHLAQRKFFLPLWFYLQLLDFFAPGGQYYHIRERAQRETANMLLLREPVNLGVVTGFYHHGKIRYLFPFNRSGGGGENEQQAADTIFIWVIADSKSPEGTEPDCWISSSPEKLEHQLPTAPFLELAKYASNELQPWLTDQDVREPLRLLVAVAESGPVAAANDPPAVVVVADVEGPVELQQQLHLPVVEPFDVAEEVYDAGAAIETLERVCMEVAASISEPQRKQEPPKQQSKRTHSSSSPKASDREKSKGGNNQKERNRYLSSSSSISSAASSSRSPSVNRQSRPAASASHRSDRPQGHHYNNDRYKDHPDAKRSRQ